MLSILKIKLRLLCLHCTKINLWNLMSALLAFTKWIHGIQHCIPLLILFSCVHHRHNFASVQIPSHCFAECCISEKSRHVKSLTSFWLTLLTCMYARTRTTVFLNWVFSLLTLSCFLVSPHKKKKTSPNSLSTPLLTNLPTPASWSCIISHEL